jgi:hypothetical protein
MRGNLMTLWFDLNINNRTLGRVEITRQQPLDLTDPELDTVDAVCTYHVVIDGTPVDAIKHRYGDGAFALAEKACRLLADRLEHLNERPRKRQIHDHH